MNKNSVIQIIPDLHLPYHHKDAFRFLKEVKKVFKPTRIISIGDSLDKHALSMHDSNPDLPSAGDELKIAKEYIKELEVIFPEVTEIESNHSSMLYRRALKHGIPTAYLKNYNEFLDLKKWRWVTDLTITLPNGQRCLFTHGRSADVLKVSQTNGQNCVQGHYHTKFLLSWWANTDDLFFGMQVGCLINQKSLAFAYAKNFNTRFILGCSVIIDSVPRLLPMVLNNKGDWIGRIV